MVDLPEAPAAKVLGRLMMGSDDVFLRGVQIATPT